MSAYGAIPRADKNGSPLPTTRWTTQDKATGSPISIDLYRLTLETASKSPGLVEYLHSVFARVVEEGRTYPMEVAEGQAYSRQAFESYFFAADVIVGVLVGEGNRDCVNIDHQGGVDIVSGTDSPFGSLGLSKDGQPLVWEDIIAGFYYVGRFVSPVTRPGKDDRRLGGTHRSNLITQGGPRMCVILNLRRFASTSFA